MSCLISKLIIYKIMNLTVTMGIFLENPVCDTHPLNIKKLSLQEQRSFAGNNCLYSAITAELNNHVLLPFRLYTGFCNPKRGCCLPCFACVFVNSRIQAIANSSAQQQQTSFQKRGKEFSFIFPLLPRLMRESRALCCSGIS